MALRSNEFETLKDDLTPEQRARRAEILRHKRPESVAHDATLDLSAEDIAILDEILYEHEAVFRYLADR